MKLHTQSSGGPVYNLRLATFYLMGASVVALYSIRILEWQGTTIAEVLLKAITLGALSTAGFYSGLGVIWGMFGPRLVKRVFLTGTPAVIIPFAILILVSACLFAFFRVTK